MTIVAAACAMALLMTCVAGCSTAGTAAAAQSAATAAQSAATAAAANVAKNATVTVTASPTGAAINSPAAVTTTAPQSIWGRWTRKGQVLNPDGSLTEGLLAELNFARNGSFISYGRVGVTTVGYMTGTFQIFGNVLTTNIGKLQQKMIYQINGPELLLTNPNSHQTTVFQRG